jgi:hypothetical protein
LAELLIIGVVAFAGGYILRDILGPFDDNRCPCCRQRCGRFIRLYDGKAER